MLVMPCDGSNRKATNPVQAAQAAPGTLLQEEVTGVGREGSLSFSLQINYKIRRTMTTIRYFLKILLIK